MTNGGLTMGSRRFRLGPSQRIMLLTATLAATAVALFVIVVRPLPAAPTALNLPWLLWAGAFAVSEALVVHWQWKREAHSFSMTDLVLGAGLYLAAPSQLITALVVGQGAVLLLHRRQTGVKLAFNVVEYGLSASLAVLVFPALSTVTGTQLNWLAAMAAILVTTVTADLSVFAVISLLESRADLRRLVELFALSLPFTLG